VTMEFIYEPEFWIAVSFLIFIGVLVYLDIHKKVASALDARALRISKELEEARRLREEAEKLLADYRRKLGDVVTEVDNIMALAATQAETLAAETRQSLKEHVERRIKLAEQKIARAEMEAVAELRNDVVDIAIAAAQNLIVAKLTPDRAKKLVSQSINALKKLN
jgi:F-type H+-transporting ATPase subunit b